MFNNFISRPLAQLVTISYIFQFAGAASFFNNATIPSNLTLACSSALLANVTGCNTIVPALRPGSYYPISLLQTTCTSLCTSGLAQYESKILSACSGQFWNGYQETKLPLAIIPDQLRYIYNLTCLMDSGRYCNAVAADYAYSLDPASGLPSDTSDIASFTGNSTTSSVNATNPCDLCLIKNLQFQAASPYFDGPLLLDSSIYESKTSSCHVTGMPLVTTTQNIYTPTNVTSTVSATPTCSKTYTIKAGDNCNSIAKSQGISTSWLLVDNNLQSACSHFPTNGTLCLRNVCQVYTAKTNDTCDSIAKTNNITVAQFKAWNPNINAGCYNLNSMTGTQLCISSPGTPYVAPSGQILAPSTASTAAPAPTNIAANTTVNCGEFYEAVPGDYCNMLVLKFGITLKDFVFLNPAINENCTNLFAFESYCVEAVGDIQTYIGYDGYSTSNPTASITGVQTPWSAFPTATFSTPAPLSTPSPLAKGTRPDCNNYFVGESLNKQNLTGTTWKSYCDFAASVWMVDIENLGIWNPSLGNTSLSTCTFTTGLRYCGKLYFGVPTVPDSVYVDDLPIRDGYSINCTEFGDVYDGWTCDDVLFGYSLTIAQFFSYNPAVGADCSNLWTDYQYCIRTPIYVNASGSSSSKTATATSTGSGTKPTSPVQSGQPSNCNKWYTAQSGDSCTKIENLYFITSAQFLQWNPAVSADCSTGFLAGFAYCVGTTDTISSTRSSSVATSVSSSATPGPSPQQPNNAISNCNKWAQTQAGDGCDLFATRNGISDANLYAWNSVLGANGVNCTVNLWAGYYYCVGVSSSSSSVKVTSSSSSKPASTTAKTSSSTNVSSSSTKPPTSSSSTKASSTTAKTSSSSSTKPPTTTSKPPTTTTKPPTSTSKTTSASPAPSPQQAGNAVANCNKFAITQAGDWCDLFATRNGISDANLYAWNTVLGANGVNCATSLFAGYYYCVGVSG